MADVRVGIAGIGFMGMIHFLAYRKVPGAKVAAICTPEKHRLAGDWTDIRGNFGPPGTHMDLSEQAKYERLEDMLADPNVDLIDICAPTDMHTPLVVKALEAGKNVLCEKPIALKVADADRMLDAARASGRLFMVGQVLPFFPEFAFALDAVRSGRYGALQSAHLRRVISRPDWSPALLDVNRSGGPAVDLHIHDAHYVCLLGGVPQAVHSRGVVDPSGAVVYLSSQYLYDRDPAPAISVVSGAITQNGRPFAHGFDIHLEQATLAFDFADFSRAGPMLTPLSVILPDGTVERPELGSGDPVDSFTIELTAATEAVRTGKVPDQLSSELARQALAVCWAEVESVKSRRTVEVT